MRDPKYYCTMVGSHTFPLVPLPKKCVTKLQQRPGCSSQVSISSTSEEVRDLICRGAVGRFKDDLVSISSTSEEVRDRSAQRFSKAILGVSISSTSEEVRDAGIVGSLSAIVLSMFPLVPLPKKCVTHTLRSESVPTLHC